MFALARATSPVASSSSRHLIHLCVLLYVVVVILETKRQYYNYYDVLLLLVMSTESPVITVITESVEIRLRNQKLRLLLSSLCLSHATRIVDPDKVLKSPRRTRTYVLLFPVT
jgi:hypothetical protein